jgi:hypothetical protein
MRSSPIPNPAHPPDADPTCGRATTRAQRIGRQRRRTGETLTPTPSMTKTRWSIRHIGSRAEQQLIGIHDTVFSSQNRAVLKQTMVQLSVAAFLCHLALIFLARSLPSSPLAATVGTNFLSAVATPFNIILFYEVLTLIAAIPASTTRSIANQFEIVSLIFIRDVFKSLTAISGSDWLHQHLSETIAMLIDMWAGLLMFALVTVFQHIALRQVQMPKTEEYLAARARFIEKKKLIAVGLTALLLLLAAYNLAMLIVHTSLAASAGQPIHAEPFSLFYNDVFTVMIFTDVLVLILSLLLTGRYEMVFRNAAYVISIILIRLSLTESRPYGAALALLATVFGIATSLLFNYHSRISLASNNSG